jgi:eukaryotic-like serine/threonine-protein kinase
MFTPLADRILLFVNVAFAMCYISRRELTDAMREWASDKTKTLSQILLERQVLTDDECALLEVLVDQHIQDHNGDIKVSLASLRRRLSLFAAMRQTNEFEPRSALNGVSADGLPRGKHSGRSSPAGDSLRYKILRPHAKGGVGQIFVAADTTLHREVALKEIRAKHAHDPVNRARFLAEAEITSKLEHPGIIPIYELGTHDDGRQFYTMRFIKGETLSTAIRRFHAVGSPVSTNLEFRWLLRRFQDTCNTTAYAHSRAVLHRDLKPSNIMLGQFGETLVLDWGLAKVIGRAEINEATTSMSKLSLQTRSDTDTLTANGDVVGTPAYMSPEQADGRLDDIGLASDVYSLGATLYFLLTARSPFVGELDQVLQAIKQGQFPSPRSVKPKVPRALDAICRKAMALLPSQRYCSALALAADIERWLADEPVDAWRDAWPVRAGRWLRRRQSLVASLTASAAVAILALSTTVPFLSVAWRNEAVSRENEQQQRVLALRRAKEAEKQRAQALVNAGEAERQRVLAEANEKNAQQQRDRAESALKFLVEAFRKPDPAADGRTLKVVDLLDRAAKGLETSFADQPLMRATLLNAIGETFSGLGLPRKSLVVFQRATALRRENLGADHPDTLDTVNSLAMAYQDLGELDKAIPLLETTRAMRRAKLGATHPATLESMNDLAAAYWEAGQLKKAIPLYETTLSKQRANVGSNHPDTITMMDNLAVAYTSVGRPDKAIPLHCKVLANLQTRMGAYHPDTLVSMNNLARAYEGDGRISEAIKLHQKTLPRLRAKLGQNHPTTLTSMNNLARAYQAAGILTKAVPLYEEVLAKRRAKLGDYHPDTVYSGLDLANAYFAAGQPRKAVPIAREFLEKAKNPKSFSTKIQVAISQTAHRLLDVDTFTSREDVAKIHRNTKEN